MHRYITLQKKDKIHLAFNSHLETKKRNSKENLCENTIN